MISETQNQMDKLKAVNPDSQRQANCPITTVSIMRYSYVKAFTLGFIFISSIVGAILLYNFKRLRVFAFYTLSHSLDHATHIYVKDIHGRDLIQKIRTIPNQRKQFTFLKIRYWITENLDFYPTQFNPKSQSINLSQIASSGLSFSDIQKRKQIYGLNEHTVDTQNYFEYMFSVIFTPLYLLQYFSVFVLLLQGKALFGFLLVIISMITTSGNYIALYLSDKKIKKIAQKTQFVQVLRSSQVQTIDSKEIVPGDVIMIENTEMPCDAVLIQGDVYMNEQSLTGQSVPVAKIVIKDLTKDLPDKSILFEGTVNTQCVQNSKALVIATGFTTRKGKIQQQIMNRNPQQPDFFKTAVWLLAFSGALSVVFFFTILKIKLDSNIDRSLVWLGVINFVLSAILPTLPIYFTTAYSWSIYRLKKDHILTTMPQKTVQSNRLKISCFDKTGTLTENHLTLRDIYLHEGELKKIQHFDRENKIYQTAMMLFGTCHSVRKVGNEFFGDQVDLRMYKHSNFIKPDSNHEVYTESNSNFEFEVIKVHQFESRYQSMSVLVQDKKSKKYYCFSKGAPQKMITYSTIKIPQFGRIFAQLSLNGLRTIALNYKEVVSEEVQIYVKGEREKFLETSSLFGLVTFENTLKLDTPETISQLKDAGIDCKMITGDGIFIAVQTAVRAGIIDPKEQIVVIEGKKQLEMAKTEGLLLRKTLTGYEQQKITIDLSDPKKLKGLSIALDNDYLSMNPQNESILFAKIFARVLPQSKSKIVKMIKENLIQDWQSQSKLQKLFGKGRSKVSMTGDGANDLLAIKQADVGIGISNTDASYGAAFTIKSLGQTINVVKQGKCTTQNIIQNVRYFLIVGYLNNTIDALCSTESTALSDTMSIYLTLFVSTMLPIIATFSKPNPQKKLTKHIVQDNFLSLKSQLMTWGNIILLALGLVGGFFYITRLQSYIPNPKPHWVIVDGWNPNCQLVTAMFLLLGIPLISAIFLVYKGDPWKSPIYKNRVMMVMMVTNIIIMGLFYVFNSQWQGVFETVALPSKACLVVLFLISTLSQVASFIYTNLITKILQRQNEVKNNDKILKTLLTQTTIEKSLLS